MIPTQKVLFVAALFCLSNAAFAQNEEAKVDYDGFLSLSSTVEEYRSSRLIDLETFLEYGKDPGTIILDTRSKKAFDDIHVDNAIHLNFSDFTQEKLAEVIPDKNTRILIYCNNNFRSTRSALVDKAPPLALNIPTFINLYGYGYKNIYELKGYFEESDKRLIFSLQNNLE